MENRRGDFCAPPFTILDSRSGRSSTLFDAVPARFLRHDPAYKNGAFGLPVGAAALGGPPRLCDISRTTAYKYIGLLEG